MQRPAGWATDVVVVLGIQIGVRYESLHVSSDTGGVHFRSANLTSNGVDQEEL